MNDNEIELDETFEVTIDPISLPYGVTFGSHSRAEVVIGDSTGK